MNYINIVPGEGLDAIQFGLSRDEVKALLGNPDEVESVSLDESGEGGLTEQWHYDELELSLSFDEIDDFRLTSIAVSGSDYLFDEQPLIGLTMEEVLEFLEESDMGEPEGEELESEDPDVVVEVVSFPENNVTFWFENQILNEIQWSPFIDEDEETYIWPSELE